jgi:hypothetical protein
MAWVTYFSAVAPSMSLVEKQWLVHKAHTSALQRLVLGPRLEAFSLPLLTLKKLAFSRLDPKIEVVQNLILYNFALGHTLKFQTYFEMEIQSLF